MRPCEIWLSSKNVSPLPLCKKRSTVSWREALAHALLPLIGQHLVHGFGREAGISRLGSNDFVVVPGPGPGPAAGQGPRERGHLSFDRPRKPGLSGHWANGRRMGPAADWRSGSAKKNGPQTRCCPLSPKPAFARAPVRNHGASAVPALQWPEIIPDQAWVDRLSQVQVSVQGPAGTGHWEPLIQPVPSKIGDGDRERITIGVASGRSARRTRRSNGGSS